ncbi:hypothetical protein LXA43DRAFT_900376 [Ganoderma leucocontextum]|nr:hypothetical protein LXA43DRAFT_900376 [Ganoderma leucocontextum]
MSDAIPNHSHCTPWNIYADELLHHGHGYPLWMPDPDPSVMEVEIGDVGWLHEGGFYQMFNSMKAEGEPQVRNAVPSGFEPFVALHARVGPRDKITQPFLCGRSIKQVDVDVEVATSAFAASAPLGGSAGINFGFKSTSDRGAFLVLSPPAVSRQILSKTHIINYMRANFDHWFEFANTTIGLGLRDEEILFVSGTTKTNRWAVAAFRGESRKTEGSFTANLGSLGEASLSMSVSNETLPSRYYRAGPSRHASGAMLLPSVQPDGSEASPSPSLLPEQRDQCIFMNYYRMKRRFWKPLPMRAAGAGPMVVNRAQRMTQIQKVLCL